MNHRRYYFINLMARGMLRRYRQMWKVAAVTFVSVFFVTGILLFQENMYSYQMGVNQNSYGNWILMTRRTREVSQDLLRQPEIKGVGVSLTASQIYDSEGEETGYAIGWMDEAFIEYGNISMYAGHMPQEDNEIAMEIQQLTDMGYQAELGQTITIYYDKSDGATVSDKGNLSKEYVLSGIMNSYAGMWNGGDNVPSTCITRSEFDSFGVTGWYTNIYTLDDWVETDDYNALYDRLRESAHAATIYNERVYEKDIWGAESAYNLMYIIVMTVGIFAVVYELLQYEIARGVWRNQIREMGADRNQLRQLTLLDAITGMVPSVVLGSAAAVLAGKCICSLIAYKAGIKNFYKTDISMLLKIGLAVILILAFEETFVWLYHRVHIKKQKLVICLHVVCAGMGLLMLLSVNNIYRKYQEYQKIEDMTDVSGVIQAKSESEWNSYVFHWGLEEMEVTYTKYPDIKYSRFATRSGFDLSGGNIYKNGTTNLIRGFDESLADIIADIDGVKSVTYSSNETERMFQWEGEDNFITDYIEEMEGNPALYFKEGTINTSEDTSTGKYLFETEYENLTDELYERLKPYLGETADYKAFQNGEQVLLFVEQDFKGETDISIKESDYLNYMYYHLDYTNNYSFIEVFNKCNKILDDYQNEEKWFEFSELMNTVNRIKKTFITEPCFSPQVAGVVYVTPQIKEEFSDLIDEFAYYTVIASDKMVEKLLQKQAELLAPMAGGYEEASKYVQRKYNQINITYDLGAAVSNTDSIVEDILNSYGFTCNSNYEMKQNVRVELLDAVMVYGTSALAAIVTIILIQAGIVVWIRRLATRK